MSFDVSVNDTVFKHVNEVWNAILQAEKINKYFVSNASAPLEAGKTVNWEFADHNVTLEVDVLEVKVNKSIVFQWSASGEKAKVKIQLNPENENQTNIKITESEFEMNSGGIKKALQQTQGWTDFICSLKAFLYTGVNLRNGRFSKQ